MNQAQALLMCIPATAIAISVLIWLQSIHDRIADREGRRELQEGPEQRRRKRSKEAAPSSIMIKLGTILGGDGAAMPRVRFDGAAGFSEPGHRN